ncbi:MAG: L-seryl-tRNA(Sec) selenium transferase [Candidatus Eremiobacteraeota bacterium]|nr:L-seryl-tRNA(Sec) selenium transferase [Candidatus Eremiobacteraeota bacterium]
MRGLPAVHRLLEEPAVAEYGVAFGRETVKRAIEQVLDRARASGSERSYESVVADVVAQLNDARLRELVPAINATGIVVHTNLGRSPLAVEALTAIDRIARGYSNLEFDLSAGERGSRYSRVTEALRDATGAQDAIVVNNCAAAVLLILDTYARGRETIVARNQLVEIGGGFRIPDVIARSGSILIEVGSTNRVYTADYERALSPRTALLLRTHPSNYRIEGFTSDVAPEELVRLGRSAGVPVVEDLGSGALVDLAEYGLPHERTVQEAIADGMDLVTFSGDKLLGGPQAGIIAGKAHFVAPLRSNPLLRALRVDKTTIAALAATLHLYLERTSRDRIPIFRMLAATLDDLRARGAAYVDAIAAASLVESMAYVGGGSLPQAQIASLAVALEVSEADGVAAALRRENPAVVARIEKGRVMLDLRTIAPEEDAYVIATVLRVTNSSVPRR